MDSGASIAWVDYLLGVTPGLVLVALIGLLLPRQAAGVRILTLIVGFVFARDAMTAHELWDFGVADGGAGHGAAGGLPRLWLRFTDDPVALLVLAAASLLMAVGVVALCRDLRWSVLWSGRRWWTSVLAGLLGAAAIILPFLWLYGTVTAWFGTDEPDPGSESGPLAGLGLGLGTIPVEDRGGSVAAGVLVALAIFALCGNLLEEILFRGFLQAHLEDESADRWGRWRAALLSGLLFAMSHLVLAYTVTGLGWPVLAFTLFEGLVCALVAMRHGVLGATIAHAGAIFVLASGLL